MDVAKDFFSAIIEYFNNIIGFFDVILTYLDQGFEVIAAYITLPSQALNTLAQVVAFFPSYLTSVVLSIISMVVVLRIWKIITSGD